MPYYDEEENIVESYYRPQARSAFSSLHGGSKGFWLIVGYFATMAILMVPANALHQGMVGILLAMIVAAILFTGILLAGSVLKRKLAGFNRKQMWYALWGVGNPTLVVDTEMSAVEQVAPLVTCTLSPETEPLLSAEKATRALVSTQLEQIRADGLPTRIIQNNGLYLANDFMPDVNTLFGQVAAIFGIRGYGKSNLLAVIAEELGPYALPMLIIDTKDEYSPLADHIYLPRGYRAGSPDLGRLNNLENYIGLHVKDGQAWGKKIMAEGRQVILNMPSYNTRDEAALVLCELIKGMDEWAQEHPNGKRTPIMVLMDEASTWLPQDGGHIEVSKTTQHYLNRTFFGTIVNRGRSNGWGLILANQRVQGISKSVLQAPWKFLFYQTQKVDLDQYATFGLSPENIFSLQVSECYIFSSLVTGFRTHIRERTSPHLANTPGLEQLLAYRQTLKPVHLLTDDLLPVVEMQETPASRPFLMSLPHPEIQRRQEKEEENQEIEIPAMLTLKQQQALTLYNEGKTGHREIAAVMEISDSDAYRLLIQLDTAGYIQRRKVQIPH